MFFCQTARIVAVLVFAFCVLQLIMGFAIALSEPEQMKELALRYGGGSPGKIIDRGVYGLLAAIALGALSEIGITLRTLANHSRT